MVDMPVFKSQCLINVLKNVSTPSSFFRAFNTLSEYVAKLFNRNSRSYYVVLTSLLTKGIIRYNDKGVYLSDRYRIENVENVKYIVIKIK